MDIPQGVVTVLVSIFTGGLAVELARRGVPLIADWLKRKGPVERLNDELQEEVKGLRDENRALRDELRRERQRNGGSVGREAADR